MRAARRAMAVALVMALAAVAPLAAAELDQAGRSHAWKGELGGYTVVDFAAVWCAPCWRTLPRLQALADSHPELRVLVVSVDDEVAGRDRLVEDLGLRLPVLWDEEYAIARHYSPEAMPATYLLDPAGEIIHRHTGSSESDWRRFAELVEGIMKPRV